MDNINNYRNWLPKVNELNLAKEQRKKHLMNLAMNFYPQQQLNAIR